MHAAPVREDRRCPKGSPCQVVCFVAGECSKTKKGKPGGGGQKPHRNGRWGHLLWEMPGGPKRPQRDEGEGQAFSISISPCCCPERRGSAAEATAGAMAPTRGGACCHDGGRSERCQLFS